MAEARQIRILTEAIRKRVKAGASLPDPRYEGAEPIKPEFASTNHGALMEWQAILELGLADDPHYRLERKAAMDAMLRVSERRGDFEKMLEAFRHRPAVSTPDAQQPLPPNNFVETQISIPIDALATSCKDIGVVRYHPELGLVQACVTKNSWYDRGAGSFPVSCGARVTEYRPSVSLLLEQVNFRKCKGMRKQSVWRVVNDPPVVIGRDKSTDTTFEKLWYPDRFDSREEAEKFLVGTIESKFVRETLPVEIEKDGDLYCLRFFARPLQKA